MRFAVDSAGLEVADAEQLADELDRAQAARREHGDIAPLLSLFSNSNGFLHALARSPTEPYAPDLTSGISIGGFRIEQRVGRGGMGTVYAAIQEHPERRVALKVMHRCLDDEPSASRLFEREAAAMARLRHSGIVQILTAGILEDRRPWIAMEWIDGESLDEWLTRSPTLDARLRLFSKLCDAMQHSHQRGVVHRDLKPSNVCIANDHSPRILDFGLARFSDPPIEDSVASFAGPMAGTLPWMSPEQVAGEIATPSSDVYALGLLLYRITTGRHAYPIDPTRPLDAMRTIATCDPTEHPGLRGDLRLVVRHALRKSADERIASAAQLRDEIERILSGRPVLSRKPTLIETLQEFGRRHPTAAGTLGAAFVASVLVSATLAIAVRQIDDARAKAERALLNERTAMSILIETVRSLNPGSTADGEPKPDPRSIGRSLSDRLEREPSMDPNSRASLESVLGVLLTSTGDPSSAVPILKSAINTSRSLDPAPGVLAQRLHDLGFALHAVRDFANAEIALREALALMKQVGPNDLETLAIAKQLANLLRDTKRFDEANECIQYVADIARFQADTAAEADSLLRLAEISAAKGDLDSERERIAAAISIVERGGVSSPLLRARVRMLAAPRLRDTHDFPWIASQLELATIELDSDPLARDIDRAEVRWRTALVMRDQQQFARARVLASQALRRFTDLIGADHRRTRDARLLLADILMAEGSPTESLALVEEGIASALRSAGEGSIDWFTCYAKLVTTQAEAGLAEDALRSADHLVRSAEAHASSDSAILALALRARLFVRSKTGTSSGSLEDARRWTVIAANLGTTERIAALSTLANIASDLNDHDTAIEHFKLAARLALESFGEESATTGMARVHLAYELLRADRREEGTAMARLGFETYARIRGHDHPETLAIRNNLTKLGANSW